MDGWHRHVSPRLPAACLFEPSCSVYAAEALRRHGLLKGSRLAFGRLSRCRPGVGGGHDPVP
jgi:putative membrane protein insertion efficiency factor